MYKENDFFTSTPVSTSENFVEEYTFNRDNLDVYASEASRSELVILPTLREIYNPYVEDYMLWIQKPLVVDETLTGKPDYMVSTRSSLCKTVLAMPVVILVEAKRRNFEQGWAYCLAELVAAQMLNQDRELPIYGIVTDSKSWEFGCLLNDIFTQNRQLFSTEPMDALFGALGAIFDAATP